jgi:hypothetical protein
MKIENLTLKQVNKLRDVLNTCGTEKSGIKYPIGEPVIVRTRNEGINFGILEQADETGCVISQARRIYYHKPKDKSVAWYEGVSQSGLSDDSKVSCAVEKKYIIEDYSLSLCTKEAALLISQKKSHETH